MEEEYKSGLGKDSVLPPELRKFNWGAFLLNWIWGIGNSTYIALLMFVPLVNIVMVFVLGFKGNEWAWENRIWRDVDHFRSAQRKWAKVGLAIVLIVIPLFILSISAMLKGEAYDLALTELRNSSEVVEYLGDPIEPGYFIMGEVSHSGDGTGKASLNFSISGSDNEAQTVVYAIKEHGDWVLKQLVVYNHEDQIKIFVVESR